MNEKDTTLEALADAPAGVNDPNIVDPSSDEPEIEEGDTPLPDEVPFEDE